MNTYRQTYCQPCFIKKVNIPYPCKDMESKKTQESEQNYNIGGGLRPIGIRHRPTQL